MSQVSYERFRELLRATPRTWRLADGGQIVTCNIEWHEAERQRAQKLSGQLCQRNCTCPWLAVSWGNLHERWGHVVGPHFPRYDGTEDTARESRYVIFTAADNCRADARFNAQVRADLLADCGLAEPEAQHAQQDCGASA